jgi:Myb-like DNA-binding domain
MKYNAKQTLIRYAHIGKPIVDNTKRVSMPASTIFRSAPPTKDVRHGKRARKSIVEEARRLRELKAQVAEPSLAPEIVDEAREFTQADLEESPPLGADGDDDDDDDEEPAPSALQGLLRSTSINKAAVAKIYEIIRMQDRQSNKENINMTFTSKPKSFIDRQDNAQRVSFDGDSQAVRSKAPRNSPPPHKRRYNRIEEEEDEDDEFEVTTIGSADRRRSQIRAKTDQRKATQHSLSKRTRSEIPQSLNSNRFTSDESDLEQNNIPAASHRPSVNRAAASSSVPPPQRAPPSAQPTRNPLLSTHNSNTPPPSSSLPPTSTAAYLRERARDPIVASKPRHVQTRRPYTAEEEERLVELIEQHGSSYTLIKQFDECHVDGPLLEDRTQVQLKDKAQELKYQMLR